LSLLCLPPLSYYFLPFPALSAVSRAVFEKHWDRSKIPKKLRPGLEAGRFDI
jgi:hypothetical protein